jgi:hypothetical protein
MAGDAPLVMRGLDPRIHREDVFLERWIAGSSPAMTDRKKRPGWAAFFVGAVLNSMQAAEGVNQHQNWNRHTKHPQQ